VLSYNAFVTNKLHNILICQLQRDVEIVHKCDDVIDSGCAVTWH